MSGSDAGPVEIPRGKIVANRFKILQKLGEGGCGAVYKVEDLKGKRPNNVAALKAESNDMAGGTVLKLEVQVLRRLAGNSHVAQLLHSGKKERYCYMVMTLLGDNLGVLTRKNCQISSISTQIRVGLNILYGIKQIHDVGFVHRDLKPANIAIGRPGTPQEHFLHILDFGLAREFVVKDNGQMKMRRPREKALFRGTTRYCSINTHEKIEQGRVDDLWSFLYLLAELRGSLPWQSSRDKKEILEKKKLTEHDVLLENSPVELVQIAQHLSTLTYYSRPNYLLIYNLLKQVMENGRFKFNDPWDWTRNLSSSMDTAEQASSAGNLSKEMPRSKERPISRECMLSTENCAWNIQVVPLSNSDAVTFFPAEAFSSNQLGF